MRFRLRTDDDSPRADALTPTVLDYDRRSDLDVESVAFPSDALA
jgi:hypothetical protein